MAHMLYKNGGVFKRIKKLLPRSVLSMLSSIRGQISPDDSKRAVLCFREALIVALKGESSNDTKPIGGYCIQVESIGPQNREFLVHVYSTMTIDGHLSGIKLISSTTEKLQCLEEKYIESFLRKEDGLHEKSLIIGLEEDAYRVETIHTCPCDVSPLTETKNLTLCQYQKLISEGANILLMRYLAVTNYEGTLHLQNITVDGEIVISDYTCIALRDMELHGHYQEVYTIERRIHKGSNLALRLKTYLTSRGQILIHDWLDMPYIVQQNPLQDEISETFNMQISLRERWMQDIEMLAKYLDMKSCNVGQYVDYLADHPELKQLIADYIQTLLVVKPDDVIDFTIQHLKAFASEPKI